MEHECTTPDTYVTEKEAARQCGMSAEWLRKQRRLGHAPPFAKYGRAVRYSQQGLRIWCASQLQSNGPASNGRS